MQFVGVARRDDFADALTGGVDIGRRGGPIVLTPTDSLHTAPNAWLCANADSLEIALVYGGTNAINDATAAAVDQRIADEGC